jgi:ribosomal protein L12E/L44/L45/RPP1/RPP2
MAPVSLICPCSVLLKANNLTTDPALAALDLSTTKVGKLSADGCSFAIEQGELEFEVEENEITLTVADLNGEWGIFIPVAGAGAAGAAAGASAAVDAAGAEAAAGGEEAAAEDELLVDGAFDTPVAVDGGNVKTDILFPGNVSSLLRA